MAWKGIENLDFLKIFMNHRVEVCHDIFVFVLGETIVSKYL